MRLSIVTISKPGLRSSGMTLSTSKPTSLRLCGSMVGPFQFAGYSSMMTSGFVGLQAINETCQFDFGPEARVCTETEFFESPNAAAPSGPAWVGVDKCAFWTDAGGGEASTVIDVSGKIAFSNSKCFNDAFVTCCARLP